jgi:hypothetical protein
MPHTLNEEQRRLVYELIFSEQEEYLIHINEYCSDMSKFESFIDEMAIILNKSGIKIVRDSISVDNKTVHWELILRK